MSSNCHLKNIPDISFNIQDVLVTQSMNNLHTYLPQDRQPALPYANLSLTAQLAQRSLPTFPASRR